jgi:hypothetical protein
MNGLHHIAGAESAIAIAGKTYRAAPLTLGMRAEIEAQVVARRADVLDEVLRRLETAPARHHEALLDAALRRLERRRTATAEEVAEFLATFDGAAFVFWLLVRDRHPEIDSPAAATAVCRQAPLGQLQARLDLATGEGELKNSAGRAEAAIRPAGGAKTTEPSPGPSFTAASCDGTAGPPTKSTA